MKTYIFLMALFFSINVFSQQSNSAAEVNRYLEKSVRQKKAANILSLTGGGLMVTGIIVASTGSDGGWFFSPNQLIGAAMFSAGTLSALASVPFYILSGRNKSKALKISPKFGSFRTNDNKYVTAGLKVEF
jgi:hypothetical protein